MTEETTTLALKEYISPECTCAVEGLRQSADVLKGTITRLNLETR